MKKVLLFIAASAACSFSAVAQLSCDTLRDEIANKIINNNVPENGFRLDIVPMEHAGQVEGQIVGSCGGGTNNIIYTRFRNGETYSPAPAERNESEYSSQSEYNSQPEYRSQSEYSNATAPAQSDSVTGRSLTDEMDSIIEKSNATQQSTGSTMVNE